MVVLAIILALSVVILSSQSTFNKTLVLANTAYDVALTLRSAETYGLGSRAAGTVANAGYGLHFEKAQPGTITLFADAYPAPSTLSVCHPTSDASAPDARPGNCVYDSAQGEKVVDYTLGNGITVSDFCAYAGSWSCANNGSLSSLDIIFSRPNPEPLISTNGLYSGINPPTAACLVIHSPQGGSRFISIGASGQIIANAASDPSSCHE
ncbi:type II secretion system GspH family protein [Patescibacteria group bacterium]|nr:type II secretion system GspH family protein [Patescibacteria group bacterium]